MLTTRTLARINKRPRKIKRLPLAIIGAGFLALAGVFYVLASSVPLAIAALLAGALGVLGAYMVQRARSTIPLTYGELDAEFANRFTVVSEACKELASTEKIWRVSDASGQQTLKAGDITFQPAREPARVGLLETPGIRANIPIWGIDAGDKKIFFFPEAVLIYRGERYEGISYKSLKVTFAPARFFEEEEVPEDAEIVDRTWRYTREDGSPDRRYTPNPQIPVVLYGLLHITGPSGLDVRLQVSSSAAAARFARAFGWREREGARREQSRRAASGSERQENNHRPVKETEAESAAREALGLPAGASMGEITRAYRKLALTYHPDKVANLPPEVREFADSKMKEINAAYAELKRRRTLRSPVVGGGPASSEER